MGYALVFNAGLLSFVVCRVLTISIDALRNVGLDEAGLACATDLATSYLPNTFCASRRIISASYACELGFSPLTALPNSVPG